MTAFEARLARGGLLLDGAIGSALMQRGLPAGTPPEAWIEERPEAVREIHAGYLRAGSDVIQTNTFGASAPALARHGAGTGMRELNVAAARIARDAAAEARREVWVAGCLGPSGLLLPPVGGADPMAVQEAFAAQAAALAEGGADYLSVETMFDIEEALCALRGALSAARLPVSVCLAYERKPRGFFTIMGNRLEDAGPRLAEAGAAATGANCSLGSGDMLEACAALVRTSPVPVVVKPNAGLPRLEGGRPVYEQRPAAFAEDGAAMMRLGAAAAGGCCGTGPAHIAALRGLLDARGPGGDEA